MRHLRTALVAILLGSCCMGKTVEVGDVAALRQAVAAAKPGDEVLLAPGDYAGGLYFENIHGQPDKPIVIAGKDRENPPRIVGGGEALHFSEVTYVVLRDLVTCGQTGNGINIDDAGSFDTPAHHVTLERVTVRDVGPEGNRDGIKLSGLDDFVIRDCTIEEWGDGGSGIDMVGCHRGMIENCRFRAREGGGSNAIQNKGGTSGIHIRRNVFRHAGARAINIGGSTGLQFFRPKVEGFEARDIMVEGNIFIGSQAPVAFVGVDGAIVRLNTIYLPERWALRILQETTAEGFVPCRNGVFTDNIIVFRSDAWAEGGCNIGPNTAPGTFEFARNVWHCQDNPARSTPVLPAAETEGIHGLDPKFVDPAAGNFALRAGSPAAGHGHTALPADAD